FIQLAGETNRKMPEFVREKVLRTLNRAGKSPSQAKILVLGVAYKRDLNDCRESPALTVMRLLEADGATLAYHDPYVPDLRAEGFDLSSVELTEERLGWADLVLITTDHSGIDYGWVVEHSRQVVDTRNATRGVPGRE